VTLRIDRLSLRLPAGLKDRAPGIARRVAEALAETPSLRGRDVLRVPAVRTSPHASNADIAAAVARGVRAAGDRS